MADIRVEMIYKQLEAITAILQRIERALTGRAPASDELGMRGMCGAVLGNPSEPTTEPIFVCVLRSGHAGMHESTARGTSAPVHWFAITPQGSDANEGGD